MENENNGTTGGIEEAKMAFKSHKIGDNCPSVCGVEIVTAVDGQAEVNPKLLDDVMPVTRFYLNNTENFDLYATHSNRFITGVAQTEYELTQAKKYLDETIQKNSSDIDYDFLGFLETYKNLSEIIPLKFRVLDLGCAFGFQQVFFKNHEQYRGIDVIEHERRWFNRNAGFEHGNLWTMGFDNYNPEERFVIVNAVTTDESILDNIKKHFKYLYICYPKN